MSLVVGVLGQQPDLRTELLAKARILMLVLSCLAKL